MAENNEIRELYGIAKRVHARLRVLEQTEYAENVPDPVAQGDILVADATPLWSRVAVGGAHSLLKTNAGGTAPAWTVFDWDDLAAGAGADMIHSHQSNGEGAKLDHGAALTGMSDDDHPQYLLATGTRVGASSSVQDFTNRIDANGGLHLTLPLKGLFSGQETRLYQNVAQFNEDAGGVVGTIKIRLPTAKSNSNTMMVIRVVGYNYATDGVWVLYVSGYNYGAGGWMNAGAALIGTAPFASVRLGDDGTYDCILLGTTSTTWQYPQVWVEAMFAGYSNEDGFDGTWEISRITSESGYTIELTPTLQKAVTDHGGLSGLGDDDHGQYYNATRHTKAVHDALALDHGSLTGLGDYDHEQYLRSGSDDVAYGRVQWNNTSNGNAYNTAPIEILEDWSAGAGQAPHISFHYGGAVASQLGLMKGDISGDLCALDNPGTGYEAFRIRELKLYSGTTLIGHLTVDATWLRINESVAKNIYSPRYFRADGGLAAGNTIPGSGEVRSTGDARIGGGLQVGSLVGDPDDNDIHLDGSINESIPLGCFAYCTTATSLTTATWTTITWTTQISDTDGCFAPSSAYLYAKHAGYYNITASVAMQYAGSISLAILKNGGIWIAQNCGEKTGGYGRCCVAATMVYMSYNDYFYVQAMQSTGSTQILFPATSGNYSLQCVSMARIA